MKKIDTKKCKPVQKLFHNELITVYPKKIPFTDITFWEGNLRTMLAFDVLKDVSKSDLKDLPLEEVTNFLLKKTELKLNELAKSIDMNGVRVPLIIKDDGTLLDGNRRFFSCAILSLKYKVLPKVLKEIPVWIVKDKDLNEDRTNKILAEANFVKDLKVPWPHEVRAMVVSEMFDNLVLKKGKSEEDAYLEIEEIYSLKKSEVRSYIETIKLTKEYISSAGNNKDRIFKLRENALKKFVYFWEFRNKALNGRGSLNDDELKNVKPLFFTCIENDRLKNIKQVEPFAKSYREKDLWKMLTDSKGTKIEEVVIFYAERKKVKSAEDKVRNFLKWLKTENEKNNKFTKATYKLLAELKKEI